MANKVLDTRIILAADSTANLTTSAKIWLKDELIIENLADGSHKIKFGDGVHTWADLPYFNAGMSSSNFICVTQNDTTDIAGALASAGITDPDEGMFLIIKTPSGGAMGYVYVNSTWTAFSGNVLAQNVFFTDDITCAGSYTQVGNVTKTNTGTTTINATGKSLVDVMRTIFTKELQPTATQPSVSLTFSQAGAYEVGTTVTPSYSAILNAGSYTYGPATGIAATGWTVTDTDGNSSSVAADSFTSFVVTDTTNYKITAEASYNEGAVANTNLGNPSNPAVKIAAGTKNKVSSAVTGYRSFFYGIVENLNALDSTAIRALTNGKKASAQKVTVSVNGNTNAKRIIVAIPTASGLGVKSVSKTDGLVTDITSTYSKTETVMVDGANNVNNTVSYDIWTYQPASIDSAEVHEITIG